MTDQEGLARVRENQRRSRARRKEYVQELESKVRGCELQGVQASSNIQVAARKVLEENKKLRALLGLYGVSDATIDQYLESPASVAVGPAGPVSMASQSTQSAPGYGKGISTVQPQAGTILDSMLNIKVSCHTQSCSPGTSCSRSNSDQTTTPIEPQTQLQPSIRVPSRTASLDHSAMNHSPYENTAPVGFQQLQVPMQSTVPLSPTSQPGMSSETIYTSGTRAPETPAGPFNQPGSQIPSNWASVPEFAPTTHAPPISVPIGNYPYDGNGFYPMPVFGAQGQASRDPVTHEQCLPGMECDCDNPSMF